MNQSVDPPPFVPSNGEGLTSPRDPDHALLAPHALRLLAFAVDVAVATVVPGALVVLGSLSLPGLSVPWWAVGLVVVLAGLAGIGGLSVWLTGGLTMGKALTGLTERRVLAAPSRDLSGLAWSLSRHSLGYVFVDVLGLGASLALVNRRRRCLHDIVFRSEVVFLPPRGGEVTSAHERGKAFAELLRAGVDEASERYGWMTFLLRWWVRVVLVIASIVFFLFKLSGLAPSAQAATPAMATTAAPSIVGPAGTAAIVASTGAATLALATVTVPDGQRAYTGLEIAAVINVAEAGPAGWDRSTGTLFVASGDRLVTIDPDTGATGESDVIARSINDVTADPGTGTVWVSSGLDQIISVIDSGTTDVIETIPIDDPVDLVNVADDGIVYVASRWGTVTAVDTTSRTIVKTIDVPLRSGTLEYNLGRMASDPVTRRLYIGVRKAHVGSNYVSVIDTSSGVEIAQLDVDLDPRGLAVDPVSHSLFVTDERGSLRVIDTRTHTPAATLEVPVGLDSHGDGLVLDPPSGTLVVSLDNPDELAVIDAATHRVLDSIALDRAPTEVEIDTETGIVYVSAYYYDQVYVLRPR